MSANEGELAPRSTGALFELDAGVVFSWDVSVEEQHELDADLTDHPVEEGVDVSDHIQLRPFRLVVDGFITATPLQDPEGTERRHIDAWEELVRIWEARKMFTVVTGLATYENMVLLRVPVLRNADNGDSVSARVEMRQVRVARAESVRIPPEAPADRVRASVVSPRDDGRQATDDPSSGDERRGRSVLAAITGRGR